MGGMLALDEAEKGLDLSGLYMMGFPSSSLSMIFDLLVDVTRIPGQHLIWYISGGS